MSDALLELLRTGGVGAQRAFRAFAGGKASDPAAIYAERSDAPLRGWIADEPGVAIVLPVRGVVSGTFALLFGERAAGRVCAAMRAGAGEESALCELGNVLASSFVNAVAPLFGGTIVPGLPAARHGALPGLMAALASEAGPSWRLRCTLLAGDGAVGHLAVWLDLAAADKLRAAG